MLIWLCLRRRTRKRASQYFVEPKQPTYRETAVDEFQHLRTNDVFAPFGGKYAPFTFQRAELTRAGYQRTRSQQERRVSDYNTTSQQTAIVNQGARPPPDDGDTPLPDFEKTSMTAPPLIDHPALHPLPGQSPEVPTYHPGQKVTSPDLAQHPAYLAKHPSLVNKQHIRQPSADARESSKTHRTFSFRRHGSLKRLGPSSKAAADKESGTVSSVHPRKLNRLSKSLLRRSYNPITTKETQKETGIDMISPIPGRTELPAVVPQELSSTPAKDVGNRVNMFKLAAERRLCTPGRSSSEVGLSLRESPPLSPPSNQPRDDENPSKWPSLPVETDTSIQSPQYQPSPRSAESPDLQSPYYQSHIVSPDVPDGKFVAFGHRFDKTPHVSQMQMPPRSTPPPTSKYSMPVNTHSPSPPQRPRIDTTMSMKSPRSPPRKIERSRKLRESLGKGNEHVMSWATYTHSNASSVSSSTPRKRVSEEELLPPALILQSMTEEDESPVLPRAHPSRCNNQEEAFKPAEYERWSGSTARLQTAPVSPAETISVSPSCYSQDVDGYRYSSAVAEYMGKALPDLPMNADDSRGQSRAGN